MPTISKFFGILIKMFFNDHGVPHFHIEYEGREAKIAIETGQVIAGSVSPRALRLVEEWRQMHVKELLEDWELAKSKQPPKKIAPLD